jgi:hypothetical protein
MDQRHAAPVIEQAVQRLAQYIAVLHRNRRVWRIVRFQRARGARRGRVRHCGQTADDGGNLLRC